MHTKTRRSQDDVKTKHSTHNDGVAHRASRQTQQTDSINCTRFGGDVTRTSFLTESKYRSTRINQLNLLEVDGILHTRSFCANHLLISSN